MPLRLLIADDEPPARARLRQLVHETGHEVCAETGNALEALEALRVFRPDAALLDIEMPGEDGLSLARSLSRLFPATPLVMVTAHAEHALEAFDVPVCDYLLKPVRRERLARALDRVAAALDAAATSLAETRIRIQVGRREHFVPLAQIDCFVAEEGYVLARSARLEGFVDSRLAELETRLGPALVRVHRSCLAVRSAIAGIETRSPNEHRLLFRDGLDPVPISRRQLPEVRRRVTEGG